MHTIANVIGLSVATRKKEITANCCVSRSNYQRVFAAVLGQWCPNQIVNYNSKDIMNSHGKSASFLLDFLCLQFDRMVLFITFTTTWYSIIGIG